MLLIYNPRGLDSDFCVPNYSGVIEQLKIYLDPSEEEITKLLRNFISSRYSNKFFNAIELQQVNNRLIPKNILIFDDEDETPQSISISDFHSWVEGDDSIETPAWILHRVYMYGLSNGYFFTKELEDSGVLPIGEDTITHSSPQLTKEDFTEYKKAVESLHDVVQSNRYNCDCQKGGVDAMSIDTDWLENVSSIILDFSRKLLR